jgi:hypothetical protein
MYLAMKLLAASSEVSEKQISFMRLKRRGIDPAGSGTGSKTAFGGLKANYRIPISVNFSCIDIVSI